MLATKLCKGSCLPSYLLMAQAPLSPMIFGLYKVEIKESWAVLLLVHLLKDSYIEEVNYANLGSMYCEPKLQHSPNQTQIWIVHTCGLFYLLVVLLNCSSMFHVLWPLNSRLSCSKNQYLFDCHELWLWKVLNLTKKALGCI